MKPVIRRIFAVLIILFVIVCSANAQQKFTKEQLKNSTPEQRANFITDTLRTVLNLTTVQYNSMYKVNLDIAKRTSVLMKSDESKMWKFKKIKALQEERESGYKKFLSAVQFKLYLQKKDELIKKIRAQYKHQ